MRPVHEAAVGRGQAGWPWPLSDAEILERVVALNAARAAEEAQGRIRWLRPDYQLAAVGGQPAGKQATLGLTDAAAPKSGSHSRQPRASRPSPLAYRKSPWPQTLPERAKAIGAALATADSPQTAEQLAQRFLRAKPADVHEILETLAALGQAHESDTPGAYLR